MVNCKACNRPIPEGSDKCPTCYAPVEINANSGKLVNSLEFPPHAQKTDSNATGTQLCPKCAKSIPKDVKKCPYCHTQFGWLFRLKSAMGKNQG